MKNFSIFRMGSAVLLLLFGGGLKAQAGEQQSTATPQKNYDVRLTLKSATVQSFTEAFTKQTGVLFSYESALASMSMGDVTVEEKNAPLDKMLQAVFSKRGFKYKIVNRVVVLTYAPEETQAKKGIVTGFVSDDSGMPMIGATVVVKGTIKGTTTGSDGSYSIPAEPGETLSFSFLGCVDQEIPVGSRTSIDVTLSENAQQVDEVVVVGYGTQLRKTVTSAISKVDGKTLEGKPVNSIGDGLKGRIAGVQIATANNTPGADPKFLIRGGSSVNLSNDPIIMVDGVQREMTGLNPNDIESIEVLKDAASAGIYGSRASNGVVLITTKKGSPGRGPQIVFEGQWAYENAATKFDLMNAKDYIATIRPAIAEGYCGGADPSTILYGAESAGTGNDAKSRWTTRYLAPGESLPKGYNWIEDPVNPGKIIIFQDNDQQKQWFDDGFWQNYYVGVNGGNESIKYAASAGYTDDGGVGIATGFSRFTFHGNTSFKVTKRLTASTTFDYSQIEQQELDGGGLSKRNSVIRGLSIPNTHRDWYDAEAGDDMVGTPALGPNNTTLPAAYYNYYYSDTGITMKRSSANINLAWEIVDGLKAVAQLTNNNRHTRSHFFVKNNPTTGTNIRPTKEGFSETNRLNFQTYLNYKKSFAEKHNLDVVAGYDYTMTKANSMDIRVQGAVSDKIPIVDVGSSNITNYPKSTRTKEALLSYFGRVNYDYMQKYILSLVMRADASSKFATGNRWGYFPAASAGWVIDNEDFWVRNKAVSSLKLRASYGLTGNNGIGLYDTYGSYNSSYVYNGNMTTTTNTMPNENLKWETTAQLDLGIDVGFADERVRVSFDYYNKVTSDMLFYVNLPNTSGYSGVTLNIGKVRFYGVDFSVSSTNISKRDFTWTTDFTYNFNMNRVLKLYNNGNDRNRFDGITMGNGQMFGGMAEGERMGRIYGYKVDHIIETQADADAAMFDAMSRGFRRSDRKQIEGRKDIGDYEWMNRPGSTQKDGRDIINAEDQFLLGYALPHSTGGLGNTFKYKNWSLNVYVDYALGHSIQNDLQMRYFMATMGNCNYNLVNDVSQCWQQPGDKTKYARFTANDADWGNRNFSRTSDVFVEKGDYLCLRDISLSYTLPKRWTSKLGMQNVTFTVSGNTLCYWTAVKGISPEAATTGGLYDAASTYDTDFNPYPPTRKILFSAKFTF